jgi:PHD/YefM family antitoxin component YafN of YafNO toxin-antitoxin module
VATNQDHFVVDQHGKRTAVLVDIERYSELLEAQEELEAIRAFDDAKTSNDESIPFSQAIKEIEGA